MANFWDLPRAIRQKIYRLDLVQEACINFGTCKQRELIRVEDSQRIGFVRIPALLAICKRAQEDAADIYYGENHFDVGEVSDVRLFHIYASPRHLRLIKKLTCTWCGSSEGEGFLFIARNLKGLEELNIRVVEALRARCSMSRHTMSRAAYAIYANNSPSPQQQLSITKSPGYSSLLKISGVRIVNFVRVEDGWARHCKSNGPIPGGFLETHVLPRLKGAASACRKIG